MASVRQDEYDDIDETNHSTPPSHHQLQSNTSMLAAKKFMQDATKTINQISSSALIPLATSMVNGLENDENG